MRRHIKFRRKKDDKQALGCSRRDFSETLPQSTGEYGDIDLEFAAFAKRLNSVIRHDLPAASTTPALIDLLNRWHTGDLYLSAGCACWKEAAWRTFDRCFRAFIHRVARHVCETSDEARELAVDVLSDLCLFHRSGESRIASYDGQYSLSTWLRVVITNKSINEHKCRWNQAEPLDSAEGVADVGQLARLDAAIRASKYGKAVADALESASRALSVKELLLLLLRYEKGLQASEIARREAVHPSTITRRLHQVQDKFRCEALSILAGKHQLTDGAIKECLAEIVDNPRYSIISFLKQALMLERGEPSNRSSKSCVPPSRSLGTKRKR